MRFYIAEPLSETLQTTFQLVLYLLLLFCNELTRQTNTTYSGSSTNDDVGSEGPKPMWSEMLKSCSSPQSLNILLFALNQNITPMMSFTVYASVLSLSDVFVRLSDS